MSRVVGLVHDMLSRDVVHGSATPATRCPVSSSDLVFLAAQSSVYISLDVLAEQCGEEFGRGELVVLITEVSVRVILTGALIAAWKAWRSEFSGRSLFMCCLIGTVKVLQGVLTCWDVGHPRTSASTS